MMCLTAGLREPLNSLRYETSRRQAMFGNLLTAIRLHVHSQTHMAEHEERIAQIGFTELVIPGRIIHLQRQPHKASAFAGQGSSPPASSASRSSNIGPNGKEKKKGLARALFDWRRPTRYYPAEAPIETFRHLALSPSMAWEHLPDQYMLKLEALCKEWELL